jgi:hypothetical protein
MKVIVNQQLQYSQQKAIYKTSFFIPENQNIDNQIIFTKHWEEKKMFSENELHSFRKSSILSVR